MASRNDIELLRKTFLIAMSACIRDKKNPNSFDHATAIVTLMFSRLSEPDVKTLSHYIDLANFTTNLDAVHRGEKGAQNNIWRALDLLENVFASHDSPTQTRAVDAPTTAKDQLMPSASLSKKSGVKKVTLKSLLQQDKENALLLISSLTRSLDRLLNFDDTTNGAFLEGGQRKKFMQHKSRLSKFVTNAMVERKMKEEQSKLKGERKGNRMEETAEEKKREEEQREDEEIREWVKQNMSKREQMKEESDSELLR
jgi:hypothetical protein